VFLLEQRTHERNARLDLVEADAAPISALIRSTNSAVDAFLRSSLCFRSRLNLMSA
jgi:hypothetical protein